MVFDYTMGDITARWSHTRDVLFRVGGEFTMRCSSSDSLLFLRAKIAVLLKRVRSLCAIHCCVDVGVLAFIRDHCVLLFVCHCSVVVVLVFNY